jgi:hypothetical protein
MAALQAPEGLTARSAEAASESGRPGVHAAAIIETVCVAAACLSTLALLQPALVLTDTTPAGGDMTSHVGSLDLLVNRFLPEGRLGGWTQGNLAGYPLFQFYFPFPFLVMAVISIFASLSIAFKIGAVLAPVLFPAAVAISLRRMRYAPPVPAIGAILSLLILWNDRQTVWGGNLQSLLAGEICYAWGFLLYPLFLAEMWRSVRAGRVAVAAVVLEVAMGLSHGYALLFGGLASLFLLRAGESPVHSLKVLAGTHVLAFCVLGAWIVPLIAYMPYTTAFNHIWVLDHADDLLPGFMLPLAALAIVGCGRAMANRVHDDRAILWAGTAVLAILIYRVGYRLHVVDIRFLPFWLTGLLFTAAAACDGIGRWPRGTWAAPLAAASLVGAIMPPHAASAEQWARWNFGGLESRTDFAVLRDLGDAVRGRLDDPRVFYEHAAEQTSLGTVRIFESLPYLANRATLEGIYIQSSLCSPFAYYIQSELSQITSAALPDYHYARHNVDAGLKHLSLFNVADLIVRTNEMRRRLATSENVARVGEIGPYSLYKVQGKDSGFARPVALMPHVYAGAHPKEFAYEYFIRNPENEPAIVLPYGGAAPPDEWPRVSVWLTSRETRSAGDSGPAPVVTCTFGEEEVRIRTSRPGWPIRLAMAFHPRWRAEGAALFACTPGFFLVIPEGDEVVMRWEETGVERFGFGLTLAGLMTLVILVWLVWRRRGRGVERVAAGLEGTPRLAKGDALDRLLSGSGVIVLAGLLCLPLIEEWRTPQEWLWHGEDALKRSRVEEAVRCFSHVIEAAETARAPRSLLVKGLRWRAMAAEAAHREGHADGVDVALRDRARIVEEFPESEWAPESADWCGRELMSRGDYEGAGKFLTAASRMDPGSPRQRASQMLLMSPALRMKDSSPRAR